MLTKFRGIMNNTGLQEKKVVGREAKFIWHLGRPKNDNSGDDIHMVKEHVHYSDGTTEPRLAFIKNYKRDFYTTKIAARNHEEKKEWERLSNLNKYSCVQSDLLKSAATALDKKGFHGSIKQLCTSPYLYGTDIRSESLLKHDYMKRFPKAIGNNIVAVFDIETSMETNEIIMASICTNDKDYTVVSMDMLTEFNKRNNLSNKKSDIINRLKETYIKYMDDYEENYLEKAKKWEIELVDTELECAANCFKIAHTWKPDFISIWNIDFDIPKVLSVLEKNKVDPKFIFSDPAVPTQYKQFEYRKGDTQKVTASGVVNPVSIANQWHTVFSCSSYYLIDSMCVYKRLRLSDPEEASYKLDHIAEKELEITKLKFKEADGYKEGAWHSFMQENYLYEYILYNLFDCKLVLKIDNKTKDLCYKITKTAAITHLENFDSLPRSLVNDLHFYCLENDHVIGTTSSNLVTEIDKLMFGAKDWIVALQAGLFVNSGLKLYADDFSIDSNIYPDTGDLDVSAAYPTNGSVLNQSKETTCYAMISVDGIVETDVRNCALNLSSGANNAVEICTTLFKAPELYNVYVDYLEYRKEVQEEKLDCVL